MNPTKIEWCDFTANPIRFMERDGGREVWGCVILTPNEARRLVLALEAEIRAAEVRG